jgi:hypothetical protein
MTNADYEFWRGYIMTSSGSGQPVEESQLALPHKEGTLQMVEAPGMIL